MEPKKLTPQKRFAAAKQAAMYIIRKKNREGRPPLDTAPLGSAQQIGNWGGTPTPITEE
jgi:hypothetical protein